MWTAIDIWRDMQNGMYLIDSIWIWNANYTGVSTREYGELNSLWLLVWI